jgi:L-seryl-tRNA(Ser) seleniumtransferase
MVGLLKAVELCVVQDQVARSERFERVVATWVSDLSQSAAGVTVSRDYPNEAGQPIPRARVDLNPAQTGLSADMVQATLWNGKPKVAIAVEFDRYLYLTPDTLEPGQEDLVTECVIKALRRARPNYP